MIKLSADDVFILKLVDDVPVQLINEEYKEIIDGLMNRGLIVIKELGEQNYFYFITSKARKLLKNGSNH